MTEHRMKLTTVLYSDPNGTLTPLHTLIALTMLSRLDQYDQRFEESRTCWVLYSLLILF